MNQVDIAQRARFLFHLLQPYHRWPCRLWPTSGLA